MHVINISKVNNGIQTKGSSCMLIYFSRLLIFSRVVDTSSWILYWRYGLLSQIFQKKIIYHINCYCYVYKFSHQFSFMCAHKCEWKWWFFWYNTIYLHIEGCKIWRLMWCECDFEFTSSLNLASLIVLRLYYN
jgi:hypothetical protein